MADRQLTWSKAALKQFDQAISYIAADSVQNAEKVRLDILAKVDGLTRHPEIYSPDKYKLANDGSYRVFELHRYRIAYRVKNKEIYIFRIRHTSREPGMY